jgi:hypothetical protein
MSGYASDLTLQCKVLTRTPRASLALASAPICSITTTSRASAPLPPGNVRLNGNAYETWPATTSGDVTLTWSHRSRENHDAGTLLVSQDATGTETLEGTIKVEVLIGGALKRTWTGLTGTSQVYTWAQRQADDADPGKAVAFRITPVNGILTGRARTTPTFVMGA